MTAGLETLKAIEANDEFLSKSCASCEYLYEGILNNLRELKLDYTFNRVGSMFTLFFTDEKVFDFDSAKTSDTKNFQRVF